MNARYLLGIALATAAAVAACGGGANTNELGNGDPGGSTVPGSGNGGSNGGDNGGTTGGDTGGTTGTTGNTPTNSPTGKDYFTKNVHPFLAASCGGCHETGPGPAWIVKADADKTYTMMFQLGYVATDSRILVKGPHGGVTTNVLTTEQQTTFKTWVAMELKDGGTKAPPNVLEKMASCIDPQLFQDMGLQNLRTIRRNGENGNNCTGCQNAPCRTCHSGDEGSGFVMAIGNNVLPQDYTFTQTKSTNPPYLQKYFGVSPTGDPIASDAIKIKAEATQKDKPYTHPMFRLSATDEANIKAFVDDAISKYKAGTCGK